MQTVNIYSKSVYIGTANLEIGDYYMGGLYGIFTPNELYIDNIQSQIQSYYTKNENNCTIWESLSLAIELSDGFVLDSVGGITISDLEDLILMEEPIFIELAGVACNIIDKYFSRNI